MILITGAAGFIGSCMVSYFNQNERRDLIISDDFSSPEKRKNLQNKLYLREVHRDELFDWLREKNPKLECVIHLGARTDTAEFDRELLQKLNVKFSKDIWKYCTEKSIPLVYASSAATYGNGENGYDDDHAKIPLLKPLNPYGESKQEFDLWVLDQEKHPPFWAGLKFFNVYGPNEYHKGRMASVVFHAFNQINSSGEVKLFRSHNPEYKDGEQLRDFIYVKDVVKVIMFLITQKPASAIYNLGTGTARTFLDLARASFSALGKQEKISFIDTPEDIRDKYQYFTEANMEKLRGAGYTDDFTSLEKGVSEYVKGYLKFGEYY